MESINQVTDILKINMYMVSIDLKDAFYSIKIFEICCSIKNISIQMHV